MIEIKNRWTGVLLKSVGCRNAARRGPARRGPDLRGAVGFRFPNAPDPLVLRAQVAAHIEAHPGLHNQTEWGDGSADPTCGTACCVAGWACHFGGGDRGAGVSNAAVRLLYAPGLPMPRFDAWASLKEIIAALRAVAS